MHGMIFVLLILFMVVVAPIWIIFNYLGKVSASKNLSKEDEKMLEELWLMAKKVEERVETLETILDVEKPTAGGSNEKV